MWAFSILLEDMLIKDYFDDCIGQEKIRKTLSFYVSVFKKTSVFRNCLFSGQKGAGKTYFARKIGENLNGRPYYEINSETVDSVITLWDEVLLPFVVDREVVCFFDEVHALNERVTNFLLSILAPNPDYINDVRYNNQTYSFDSRRFTFLSATTEPQKVARPLKDRLKQISLIDYSKVELLQIVQKYCEIDLSMNVLEYLGGYIRNNARSATDLAQEINNYCKLNGKSSFSLNEAKDLISILNIFEFGFTNLEVQILNSIARGGASSLARLAAKSGLTSAAQKELEGNLLRLDLMEIDGQRRITPQGVEYLNRNLK